MKTLKAILHSRKIQIAVVSFLVLMICICIYRAFFCSLGENTCISGMNLSGMTPVEAHRLLNRELDDSLFLKPLKVHLPEETLLFSPEVCRLKVNTEKLLFDILHRSADTSGTLSLAPYLTADKAAIRNQLENYAARYDSFLSQPDWYLEGEGPDLSTEAFDSSQAGQVLVVTLGTPSVHLDVESVLEEMMLAFSEAVILCRENRYQITPEVLPEAIPATADAATIARKLEIPPVNDTVDRNTFSIVPGSYGRSVDTDFLAQRIQRANPGETIRVAIQHLPPEVLGEEAYFQDILGTYETRHTNDQNRNTNLQLQCDALDGLVLQPGEIFSMNDVLGERTAERGYMPAPAYSGNRLVKSPGGGVCQGTTTLYNCVLLADLEVVFRACHGVKVGYVPLGLDAAVNWLTTDFQFRNNWNFPIRLRAWLEDGYMKMQILGTDEKDYYVKMETGTGEDEHAYYARSYKCKYDKETDELISREVEAYSTYYKDIE